MCGGDWCITAAGRYGVGRTKGERISRWRFLRAGAADVEKRYMPSGNTYANNVKGGIKMAKRDLPSPCRRCTLVADPEKCEDKSCVRWRNWFTRRWDNFRTYPRRQMDAPAKSPAGVNIGGRYYMHPDHLREYGRKDPCAGCRCPRDLCQTPCRGKKLWEEFKEGKYELEK